MSAIRMSPVHWIVVAVLVSSGSWLWMRHASAWRLDRGASVLGYDAAQYALAARELSEHGRFATTFALPLELSKHATPPWPLALVQPGLVIVEAAAFKLAGGAGSSGRADPARLARLERAILIPPLLAYLGCALALAFGVSGLLSRHAPTLSPALGAVAGMSVGLAFLLDPEAQHFAAGGFTELPFTLGLSLSVLAIALGWAPRRPLVFGLLLGISGTFRGNMLWLAPILVVAAAWISEGRRARTVALGLLGYAIPLAPWWIYKWASFGSPGWDLSWVSIWDGIGGRTWFSLNHLPDLPELPRGAEAIGAIFRKVGGNLGGLLLEITRGPRALWLGSLAFALLTARRVPPLAAALWAVLAVAAASVVAAAASVPTARYMFPARVLIEAAGLLAFWSLVERAPATWMGTGARRAFHVAAIALALGWGGWRTVRGWSETRATATVRGVPSVESMLDLVSRIDQRLPAGEPIMSNLGPVLGWYARRPVVHLALSPGDLDACRRHLDVRSLLLVFREPALAWSDWPQVLERPLEATRNREWNIVRTERFATADGFVAVWLELGPLGTRLAGVMGQPAHPASVR